MKKRKQSKKVTPDRYGCPHASPVQWAEAHGKHPGNAAVLGAFPEWRKKQCVSCEEIPKYDAVGLSFDPIVGDLIWWYEGGSRTREPLNGRVAWFVPAGVHHSCERSVDADCLVLLLDPNFVRKVMGTALRSVKIYEVVKLEREDLFIWQLVSELRRVYQSEEKPDPLYFNSISVLLVVHLLRAHSGQTSGTPARSGGLSPKALRAVTQYIDEHLNSKLDLATLSGCVHLGPRQFGRLFKISTGLSPQQYVLHARVHRAHELLRTERCRVAEAAYEVGFYDQSHLDRHFRRVFGFPPSALLRRSSEVTPVARPA